MKILKGYARDDLIAICEQASVPQDKWLDRDSAGAQRQVGECFALLKAGCEFTVSDANATREQISAWWASHPHLRPSLTERAEQIKAQDAAADPNQGDLLGGEQ